MRQPGQCCRVLAAGIDRLSSGFKEIALCMDYRDAARPKRSAGRERATPR